MTKLLFGLVLLTSISVCSALAGGEGLFIPEGYSDFDSPGEVMLDRPMDIVKERLSAFPETLEGAPRLELKSHLDRADRLVVDVTETGLLDDSVIGENRRYVLKQDAQGKFVLWGYGYRHLCARSEEVEDWVTNACP